MPGPYGDSIAPHEQAPVHVPLPYSMNPLSMGIQLGLAGAASGLGYAALHRAMRLRAGDQNPVSVTKPVIIGSLIGSALGAVAGWKYGDQTMPNPYPQTWEGVDQSIQDRVAAWPKFAGLGHIVEKRIRKSAGWLDIDPNESLGSTLGQSLIPIHGLRYDINDVMNNYANMKSSWKTNHPGEAIGWGVTGVANTILGILGQIPGAGLVTKGGKILARGGKLLQRVATSRPAKQVLRRGAMQATGKVLQGTGTAMTKFQPAVTAVGNSKLIPKAVQYGTHPWRQTAATTAARMAIPSRPPETEYERTMRDMVEQSQAPAAPAATGGQTANTPRYSYGESSGNQQPPGYGYMEKNQSTKYGALVGITEKRAQMPDLGSAALNMGMYMIPGVGTGMAAGDTVSSARDLIDRLRAGQYGRAALSGLGTLGNAAFTALTLAPGGGILARLAKGLKMGGRVTKGVPKGVMQNVGHWTGKQVGQSASRVGGKVLGTTGRMMQNIAPDKRWLPALTWGGIPAGVIGNTAPSLIDMVEARKLQGQTPPDPTILQRLAEMFGSTEKPKIDYDVNPNSPTASSPLLNFISRGA